MNTLGSNGSLMALSFKRQSIQRKNVDVKMLEQVQRIIASVVVKHGDNYLPLFIRINGEVEKRKKEVSYRDIALQIASNTT